jgi:hypothetical protein
MNNEQYVSLYDYRGSTSNGSGLGKKVYEAAKEKGVHVIYHDLPEDRSKPEYNRVATYPKSFLDEYFGVAPNDALETRIVSLETKVQHLENIVAEITKTPIKYVTNSNEHDDDYLPF